LVPGITVFPFGFSGGQPPLSAQGNHRRNGKGVEQFLSIKRQFLPLKPEENRPM
jgi:hypothetical protein